MADPYNSYPAHLPPPAPDAARPVPLEPAKTRQIDRITRLEVSDKWKERFRAIDKAGGPALAELRALDFSERRLVNSNWPAFFFWPIYLPFKGLWRQAIAYFLIAFSLVVAMELVGLGKFGRVVGYGVGFVASFRANIGYYKRMVLNEVTWL